MTNSWSSAGDVDLSHWLLPDEQVHWIGKSARLDLPWGRVAAAFLGTAGIGVVVLALFAHMDGVGPFLFFAAAIVAVNVGGVVYGTWALKREKVSNRYVLTDRRAAVFHAPSRLISQTRVQGAEFEVLREPGASVGTIRWGVSDEVPAPRGWAGSPFMSMARPLLGANREERVDFTDAGDFGRLLGEATRVRAAWGAPMPVASAPKRRGAIPHPLGFLDSRAAGVVNWVVLVIGSMALVAGVVLWCLTLVGGTALFGMGAVVPLFVLVFPLFFWAVLVAGPGRNQRPGASIFSPGTRSRAPAAATVPPRVPSKESAGRSRCAFRRGVALDGSGVRIQVVAWTACLQPGHPHLHRR